MPSSHPLLVADYRADVVYAVDGSLPRVVVEATLAEHAGFLALPKGASGRWAFADDADGALVVGDDSSVRRIPIAIPAEHIACDHDGRHVVVTSGMGMNEAPWSDVVTVVDLVRESSVRFRARTGEPGVVVAADQTTGEPTILLRHREPGAIEAVPLGSALEVGPHVPVLRGRILDDLAADGHGDVVHPQSGIMAVATGRGLERFVVDRGEPRALGVIPWPGDGRPYYLRLDPDSGHATGIVRGGPPAAGAWAQWTNTFVDIDLDTGATRSVPLPSGLAFRFALGAGTAAVAVIHPDGDAVVTVDRGDDRVAQHLPIPAMTHPPRPGHLPWDSVDGMPAQRRSIALDPSGDTIAVTSGGDSRLLLIRGGDTEIVEFPTPLNEGGHLFWAASDRPLNDLVGR
ncbi:hypothetical protein LTA6_000870 [Microbacterium sp. LTA6]|uniref:hypothetical protein n=1 Tax=unclassified Microbacterium TaxID=2609290 RepID=UPI003139E892